jgi:hypothetical protein
MSGFDLRQEQATVTASFTLRQVRELNGKIKRARNKLNADNVFSGVDLVEVGNSLNFQNTVGIGD